MRTFSTPRTVLLAALAACAATQAAAQCVSYNAQQPQGTIFYDAWPNTQAVVCGSRLATLIPLTLNGRQHVLGVDGCGLQSYDVSGTGVTQGVGGNPFGGSSADGHNDYRTRHLAVLDDFPYGLLSQSSEGWTVFKINYNASGVISSFGGGTKVYFGDSNAPSIDLRMYGAKLFRVGGRVYVVARYLDNLGVVDQNGNPTSTVTLRIADFGDGSTVPPLTNLSVISSNSISALFEVIDGPGGPYLYVFSKGGAEIYNVSNPAAPQYLGKSTDVGLAFTFFNTANYGPGYPRGTAVATVNVGGSTQRRLYTAPEAAAFYVYDVTNPASPTRILRQAVTGGASAGTGLSSDGKLLAYLTTKTNGQPMVRYYSVAGDVVTEIPHSVNWNSTYDLAFTYELEQSTLVVPPTAALPNHYKVLRCHWLRGYYDTVSTSCLDTTPTAGVTVSRTSSTGTAACTGNPTHGGTVKGFPSDQFKIINASTGQPTPTVTSITVTGIDATAGNTAYASGELVGNLVNNELTWTAPADLYGEFQVTLTVSGVQTAAVQYIYLCRDPDAALAVTQVMAPGGSFQSCTTCTWLQAYTLRLAATGSEGTPDWPNSGWTVEHRPTGESYVAAPPADYVINANGTLDLTLNSTGDYRVIVNPAYPFDESPDNTATLEMHSGAVTATIQVMQNSQVIPPGGTILRSAVTTITGNGACAPGQSCFYLWGGEASSLCASPAGNPPFVCTVASNGFGAGFRTVSLSGSASPSQDTAFATTNFTVSDCASPTAPVNTTPSAGASVPAGSVQLIWNPAGGTSPITYTVKNSLGTTLCGPTTGTSCTINAAGPVTWFVKAENACGSINGTSTNFTIQGTQCTSPSSPSNSSPGAGATVPAGTVTLQWTSASGTSPITYTAKNSLGTTLCTTTSTSCQINATGPVTWFVQASNSCGSANSSSTAFSVGAACTGPSQPTLVSPASGATVPAGNVTLQWTASSGDPTISYTARNVFGTVLCGPTTSTSCTYNATGGVTWYVKAENGCSSANSSSRSFTVGPVCTAPGAAVLVSPANAFSGTGASPLLQWTAPTTGSTPFNYDVYLDSVPYAACQNLTTTSCQITGLALNSSPHSWYVKTDNSCGSSTGSTRTFTTCGQTAAPASDFTWSPTGNLTMANGYVQAQPYVGQLVTFTNTSTNGPFTDVSWYDAINPTQKSTNAQVTFTSAGAKNVRLTLSNCFGQSGEKVKSVTVAADNRPVVAEFTFTPTDLTPGVPVTFTPKTGTLYGDPDEFEWKFSDEATSRTSNNRGGANPSISRTFSCAGPIALTLTSKSTTRSKTSVPVTVSGGVGGQPMCCSATRAPQPSFDWTEKGGLAFGGMTQQQPYVGQTVHFLDQSSFATATLWNWQFPGGASSTDKNPAFVFTAAGLQDVTLTVGNCFGTASPLKKSLTVYDDVRPVTADFTWNPGGAPVGAAITFTARDGYDFGDPTTFDWTFPNGVKKSGKVISHAFTCGGANQVTLVAKRGAVASTPAAKTVTTTGEPSCCKPPNRATSPVPATGATIPGGTIVLQWGRPTQGSDPLTYDVYLDGVKLAECSDLAARQCTTTVVDGTATRFWKVIAKNDCGDTTTYPDTPSEWRFKACSAGAAPDATAFTWDKNGPIDIGGVVQQQPYVGQAVTFSYDPSPTTPATAWSWTDYQVSPAAVYEVPHPQIVYNSPGKKKLYLRATNCSGTRSITQYIDVYADLRPVEARFSFAPPAPRSLDPVTFTFDTSDEVGNPTEFTIDFGDGTPPLTTTATSVQHAYGCSKLYRASVTAKRIKPGSTVTSQAHSEDVQVSGYPCSASELVVVDIVRQIERTTGVIERGDMVLFNPTGGEMQLEAAVRDKDTGQVSTGLTLPPLPPQGSMALADIMGLLDLNFSTATLWLKRAEQGADTLPVVNAWKYLEPTTGVKYGQFLPVFPVWPASDQTTTRWITGLVHNSLNSERGRYGFVTKLTFVDPTLKDPNRVPWGTKKLILRLYDNQTGQVLRVDSLNLDNYGGYRHDYINRIFHLADGQDLKAVTVQVEVPPGVSVIMTSTVLDNATENAVVFPSQTGN